MESRTSSPAADRRRGGAARRHSVVALAAMLLFASLFVDVGIARAEYPEGWQRDPDLQALGACLGTCGSLFIIKGQLFKYAVGASCLGCLWDLAIDLNGMLREIDVNCFTGMLGQPCDGGYYGTDRY